MKFKQTVFYNTLIKTEGKEFIITSLADLCFYLAIYLGILSWGWVINLKARAIQGLDLNNIAYQKAPELNATLSTMKGFLFYLILFLAIFIIYVIVCLTLFKGIIYCRMTKKKFTKEYFIHFLKMNALFYPCTAALIFGMMVLLKNRVIGPLLFLAGLFFLVYLTIVYQAIYTTERKGAIRRLFKIGLGRIHKFLLPLLVSIIILFIILQLSKAFSSLPYNLPLILTAILFLLYFTFVRFYVLNVIKKVTHS